MNIFNNLFHSKKNHSLLLPSKVDVHSHLIPGIDDGCPDMAESVATVKELVRLGYRKAITTPHIMTDVSNNSRDNIFFGLENLKNELKSQNIEFEVEAGAEYYIDEFFLKRISAEKLITFGRNYVLIETGMLSESKILKETVFELKVNGYEPVLAHPERYTYFWGKRVKENYRIYKDLELLFQLNIISLSGHYSLQVKKMAELLIAENMVDMVGSDAHNHHYATAIENALKNKYASRLLRMNLLNDLL